MECLFDITRSNKNFGVDENGLLTSSEKDCIKNSNPYVNVIKTPNMKEGHVGIHCNIPNDVLNEIHGTSWYAEGVRKGIISSGFTDSRNSVLQLGTDTDVLRAAYVAQSIRFGERGPDYMTSLLKAKVDGNYDETLKAIKEEIIEDMPKFEHPALTAYDAEAFERLKKQQEAKLSDYVAAINRLYYDRYSLWKKTRPNIKCDKAKDKAKALEILDEISLNKILQDIGNASIKPGFDFKKFAIDALRKIKSTQQ